MSTRRRRKGFIPWIDQKELRISIIKRQAIKSPSRHAAPLFGRASIGFTNSRLTAELFAAYQAECKAENMPEEEKDKKEFYALDANGNAYSPAWITLNMRLSYNFKENLYVNTTLENILDKRYRPYGCGISAPGRNLTLSLTYKL